MIVRNVFSVWAVVVLVLTFSACVKRGGEASPPAVPQAPGSPVHAIAGTWINPDYNGEGRSAKVVYTARKDGGFDYAAYDNADGSGEVYKGKAVYKKIWKDKKGYSYGLSTVTLAEFGMSWETLDRISPDGKTLEVQPGASKIDPKGARYSVYHRQ
ncbi:MAG: hypothetical protein JXD23_07080 [Spirochaetales bacterium]|nr:hypothetical protein [Spirochaetales bacterium]